MNAIKHYELLKSLPAYGPMHIAFSNNGQPFYSEGVAIRFYKKDGTDWVGNFAPGSTELTEIITLHNCPYPLVISNGSCYLIDIDSGLPIAILGNDYTQLYVASRNRYILVDSIAITIVEPDGNYWHTERISWDGLKVLNVERNIITGEAFSPTVEADEWHSFSYDIDSRILQGGSYTHPLPTEKKWWKFW
ncbi:hypothetical protein D3C72_850960 [compost metagenome]